MRTSKEDTFYELRSDDTVWMDREGVNHDINFMDFTYVLAVVRMLENKNRQFRNGEKRKKPFVIPTLMYLRLEQFKVTNPEYFL